MLIKFMMGEAHLCLKSREVFIKKNHNLIHMIFLPVTVKTKKKEKKNPLPGHQKSIKSLDGALARLLISVKRASYDPPAIVYLWIGLFIMIKDYTFFVFSSGVVTGIT